MKANTLLVVCAALVLSLTALSAADAQWVYMGNNSWMNVGPQASPGGSPTVTLFDARTGAISYNADYGLQRMGLPPIVFQNQTGGVTVYRQYRYGK
jgi:hypothetical protein